MNQYFFRSSPKPVGAIIIFDGVKVHALTKPSRFHLWMMRICFGWKWEDAK